MFKALLGCLLLLLSTAANASSTLRCGSALVSINDTAWEVLNKCGEPTNRSDVGFRLRPDNGGLRYDIPVEEWIYGPRSGMYYIPRFEGNRLRAIRSERNL